MLSGPARLRRPASKDARLLNRSRLPSLPGILRPTRKLRATACAALRRRFVLLCVSSMIACAAGIARAQVTLPESDAKAPLMVTADSGASWTQGSYEVWALEGNCRLSQGRSTATAREAVLWIDRGSDTHRTTVLAYLEGEVVVRTEQGGARLN